MDRAKLKMHIDRISQLVENHSDSDLKCAMIKTIMSHLSNCDENALVEMSDCFEGLCRYNNFLTERESYNILKEFKNYDNSKGAPFDSTVLSTLQGGGKVVDKEGVYNKWALYTTMCKFASDQGNVIMNLVNRNYDEYVNTCYNMAVAQLEDVDRPRWVRWYFNLF